MHPKVSVNSVLPAAERMMDSADMNGFLAKLLLRCLVDNPGSKAGTFNCPESLQTLVKLLQNLKDLEVLQLELLHASIPLLNSHVDDTSLPSPTKLRKREPLSPRLSETNDASSKQNGQLTNHDDNDCGSKFNHIDGRIILSGEDGLRFFSALKAPRSMERKASSDSKNTFTCTHAFTSLKAYHAFKLANHWSYSATVSSFSGFGQAYQHKVTRLECSKSTHRGENTRKRDLCREPIIQHYYTHYGAVLVYMILPTDADGSQLIPGDQEYSSRHRHAH